MCTISTCTINLVHVPVQIECNQHNNTKPESECHNNKQTNKQQQQHEQQQQTNKQQQQQQQ